jgi:hypothetical protein
MTDLADLRVSDAEREQHAELLREHATQGRLTVEELEQRLDRVYAARTRGELEPVVADLPTGRAPRPRPARRSRSLPLRPELAAYLAVNLVLVAIWAATGAGYFWPIWPILGWGLGLVGPGHGTCARRRRYPPSSARS